MCKIRKEFIVNPRRAVCENPFYTGHPKVIGHCGLRPTWECTAKKRIESTRDTMISQPRLRTITVHTRPVHSSVKTTIFSGVLTAGSVTIRCSIGRTGASWLKKEGDGRTPKGRFRLLDGYYRPGSFRNQRGFRPIRPNSGWCDDPRNPNYNQPVKLPIAASHENLWRDDGVYDVILILDYNIYPRIRDRGSAIFFHLARQGFEATEGCVAIPADAMRKLLPRLSRHTVMIIK